MGAVIWLPSFVIFIERMITMRKLRVIAATAFFAMALQVTCSAASVLFNIPTVLSANEYASTTGRSVEDVLNTVETSAKQQINGTTVAPVAPVAPIIPAAPTVNVAPAPQFPAGPAYFTPSADGALTGADVSIVFVNGIATLVTK